MTNLEAQVFADRKDTSKSQITSLQAVDPESKKHETNVQCQIKKLQTSSVLLKTITPQQSHDLTKFREIGQTEYERYIEYYIVRTPSVLPPKHRKSLLTFTETFQAKKGISN